MSKANEALDKMAENAKELGLDYEPSSVSKLAREAGIRDCTCNGTKGCLERFASLVRADERARMAEQPAQDVSLIDEGKTTLDKMADNAKEPGLDYEPAIYAFKPPSEPMFGFFDTKPNHNITFHRDGKQIGVLDFNGPEMVFTGDADESAKIFFDFIARSFKARLEEERADERNRTWTQEHWTEYERSIAAQERQRIVNLLMVQHDMAKRAHNYWHVAAQLIQADVASNT